MSGKKIKYPIHRMGKTCGFEEYEDGSIKIASLHYQKADNASLQEAAADALLKSMTEQCHKLLMPILAAWRHFWKEVVEDYSLDLGKYNYSYNTETKVLSKTLKKAPE